MHARKYAGLGGATHLNDVALVEWDAFAAIGGERRRVATAQLEGDNRIFVQHQ